MKKEGAGNWSGKYSEQEAEKYPASSSHKAHPHPAELLLVGLFKALHSHQ